METQKFSLPNGIDIVMDVFNPSAQPTAVLFHGGGQTRASWWNTARRIAANRFRAITVDARGHGESSWSSDGDYRLASVAADMEQVLGHIGGSMILIGASMGGIVSLFLAANDRDGRIDGLVLGDVTPRVNRSGVDRIHAFMRANPEGFASLEEASEAVARYNPDRARSRNSSGLMRNLRERNDRLYWHWDPRFIDSWDSNRREKTEILKQQAGSLAIPTLLIHAGRSDVVRVEEADEFRALIVSDNGAELASNAVLAWCGGGVECHYIAPGRPMQNGYVESFNRAHAQQSGSALIPSGGSWGSLQ